MLPPGFFDRDPQVVARDLVGKVLRRRLGGLWLAAQVVEVEAYYRRERGSHASLGRTPSREALFMPPGTIYMYYARGGDSLNVSCRGAGNAVLVKAARPFVDERSPAAALERMHAHNPGSAGPRPAERLCAGQTLLCRALALRVPEWNQRPFDAARFYVEDVGYRPAALVQARRLGIPPGRDEHLPYRFVDAAALASATANPLARRGAREGVDYRIVGRRRANGAASQARGAEAPAAYEPAACGHCASPSRPRCSPSRRRRRRPSRTSATRSSAGSGSTPARSPSRASTWATASWTIARTSCGIAAASGCRCAASRSRGSRT